MEQTGYRFSTYDPVGHVVSLTFIRIALLAYTVVELNSGGLLDRVSGLVRGGV